MKLSNIFFIPFLSSCPCDCEDKIFFSSTYDSKPFIEKRIEKLDFNMPLYPTWVSNNKEFEEIIKSGKVSLVFIKKGQQDSLIKKLNPLKLREIKELEIKGTFYSLANDKEFNKNMKKTLMDF